MKEAIEKGIIKNAYEHFISIGIKEIKAGKRVFYVENSFYKEEEYLKKRPDVKNAYEKGEIKDVFEHYIVFGAYEEYLQEKSFNINEKYKYWLEVNKINDRKREFYKNLDLEYRPLISIIMPVYNPSLKFLKKAIDSVKNQFYDNWEICIADDCSTKPRVKPFLENLSKTDERIKVVFREKNGHISEATNSAVNIASGEYILFLDQDDELTLEALSEIIIVLNKNKNIDVIYSDDDKIDEKGNLFDPQFKPDWSPELLLSYMYCAHLFCLKKEIYNKLGGFRKGFEGSQDYDLMLRIARNNYNVYHIPKILYHWRVLPGSTAAGGGEKHYSFDAGIRAVQEHIDELGIKGKVYHPSWAEETGAGIYKIKFPDEGDKVAIIIPTKNKKELIQRCVKSILNKTKYKNYHIYIIDNDSDEIDTISYLNKLQKVSDKVTVFKISSPNGKFSYSYINNEAVKKVKEKYILFLNNDTEVVSPEWLSQMMGYMKFPGVGSVGAKLLFPNHTIQHAGILHNQFHGFPVPAFKGVDANSGGYLSYLIVSRNYMAVTAACMLTKRDIFLKIGGFDEQDFAVAYNDVDYGFRLLKHGYRNVYSSDSILYHYEGATRGYGDNPFEEAAFIRKYKKLEDIYYNPNLAKQCTDFKLSSKTFPTILPKKKIKLLMVTHNLNFEGAPRSFFELAKGLKKSGIIEPVVFSHAIGPLMEEYEKNGIEVNILPGFNILNTQNKEQMDMKIKEYKKLFAEINPDVIYCNTVQTFWAISIARALDIPSVWNIRESEEPFSQFDHIPHVKKECLKNIQYPYQVVFVADATKNIYEKINKKNNFITIHNGFDQERLGKVTWSKKINARKKLGIRKDEYYILIVGTVCERKGQKDLVQAMATINDKIAKNIKIGIVGDRPSLEYSKEMHRMIEALPEHKRENILVFEETNNVQQHYLAADIFVCSSRVESFPKVIQEAMYYELPIITTSVYGIVEQVRDEITALYYSPGNYRELAAHIKRVVTDKYTRKFLAKNAKTALDILPTFEDMINDYKRVFIEAWWAGESRK